MHIQLSQIGKKFYGRWLFRGLDLDMHAGDRIALTGTNGSGKSTLMRMIAGQLRPTEGKIRYEKDGKVIGENTVYQHISWSAPYLDLYSDLSFAEHIQLHFRFKNSLLPDPNELIDILDLRPHKDKTLRFYSSGMLQRAKVGIALFTQSDLLLLDEPTSNMDAANAAQMLELIETQAKGRILVLASNMEREFERMDKVLAIR